MPFCVCCSCDKALEDLVNCDFAPQVCTMYGSTLLTKFNLARVQLLLALANSVHGRPVPGLQATLYEVLNLYTRCTKYMQLRGSEHVFQFLKKLVPT